MPDLIWDINLAAKAQAWANRCPNGHDPDEARLTPPYKWVGQNWAVDADVAKAVRGWFDEYKNYDYQSNYCRAGMCGHYTQMVWATTTHLGCGVAACKYRGFDVANLVCNYGPGGNYEGKRPY
ncbi:unnamed protein product [Rodentolepis nana]|uniref:SCP domain-containing protein n=1 Tax=Rodentolepis nana TaxID=102285 RepID=A0A0R3TGP2_RODNA|nr:unnamed protein product [Rodentolepis nana]